MKVSAILLTISSAVSSASAYVESTAKYYMDFSAAAYCAGTAAKRVENWNCPTCASHPGVNATTVYDRKTNTHGFVAYVPESNQVMVSFSGTDPLSIKNWAADINAVTVNYGACSGCKAHKGFYDNYKSVQPEVNDLVSQYLSAHPGSALTLTGHSLGGALASHAAMDFYSKGWSVAEVYTFGMPRFGNEELKAYFELAAPNAFRVVHYHDPVAHLPMYNWGFRHSKTEVYYVDDQSSFTVCDASGEDAKCSNGNQPNTNFADHLNYVGFNVAANIAACLA